MSIHTDPNAAHAVFAPSSADRWIPCTASAEAIARVTAAGHTLNLSDGEDEKGTAAHDELERCIGSLNGDFVDPATMPILAVDPDHPSAFGVARAINFFRQLPPGRVWVEQRVALTEQIWGRADLQHWHAESGTLTTFDLKDGFVGVDADAPQIRIYNAAAMFTYNLPVKWFRSVVGQENDFRPVPRIKQEIESAESLYTWASQVATIPAGPKKFVAGEHCTYCPLFGMCDASKDMLASSGVLAVIAGLMRPDQIRPEQRALFLACHKPVTDAFKGADKTWLKEALAKGAPAGLKVVTGVKHRAWTDPEAARALVLEKLGPKGLDVPTPAQAIERGLPAEVIEPMAPRPEGGPVLAFDNDKRPEFKRKSAAEMFAGVVPK